MCYIISDKLFVYELLSQKLPNPNKLTYMDKERLCTYFNKEHVIYVKTKSIK